MRNLADISGVFALTGLFGVFGVGRGGSLIAR